MNESIYIRNPDTTLDRPTFTVTGNAKCTLDLESVQALNSLLIEATSKLIKNKDVFNNTDIFQLKVDVEEYLALKRDLEGILPLGQFVCNPMTIQRAKVIISTTE